MSFLFLSLVSLLAWSAPKSPIGTEFYELMGLRVPLHVTELVPAGEQEAVLQTNDIFREFFRRQYGANPWEEGAPLPPRQVRHGVHPKSHGCLRGELVVNGDIEKRFQRGIFSLPGRHYEVLARFSNGGPRPQADDSIPDARGFGLKVLGVEGEPLLRLGHPGEQDFTLNSSDTFFADTAATYRDFLQTALLESEDFGSAAIRHVFNVATSGRVFLAARIASAFRKIQAVQVYNPLHIPYWSIAPFQHGEGFYAPVVKHRVVPCETPKNVSYEVREGADYLGRNLRAAMEREPACFRFQVQERWEVNQSIEDLTRPWSEDTAPFYNVAVVRFPVQGPMPQPACDGLVINPWNTLEAHKPVGGINRTRLGSYLTSIRARGRAQPHPTR